MARCANAPARVSSGPYGPWRACSSAVGSLTGTVVRQGLGLPEWGSLDGYEDCEPSFMEIAQPDGAIVTVGFCLAEAYQPPPEGSLVSAYVDEQGGEYCQQSPMVTVWDSANRLLLHVTSGGKLALSDIGTIERVPLCHTESDDHGYERRYALAVTLGAESGRAGAGESFEIAEYVVSVYAAEVIFACYSWSDCDNAGVHDFEDVVVVRK